jgi:hypothetical protein
MNPKAAPDESVGDVADLYLGNILYAIELAALSLDSQGKVEDAAFYRGIGRKLAEAHGRASKAAQAAQAAQPAEGAEAARPPAPHDSSERPESSR